MTESEKQAFDAMRELLQTALDDYLEHCEGGESDEWVIAFRAALTAAKEVTAQGVEPVEGSLDKLLRQVTYGDFSADVPEDLSLALASRAEYLTLKLKATQQPAPAQRLSYAECAELIDQHFFPDMRPDFQHYRAFRRAIETAFAEKNGITLEQQA